MSHSFNIKPKQKLYKRARLGGASSNNITTGMQTYKQWDLATSYVWSVYGILSHSLVNSFKIRIKMFINAGEINYKFK